MDGDKVWFKGETHRCSDGLLPFLQYMADIRHADDVEGADMASCSVVTISLSVSGHWTDLR